MKRITSQDLINELNLIKNSTEFKLKPENKQLETILDHELMIKFEINREIYEHEFGYYPEGDLITDEEIQDMRNLEKQIEKDVKDSFMRAEQRFSKKPRGYNKKNNMNHLFR